MLSSSDKQRETLSAERVDSGVGRNNEDVIPSTVRHHSTGSIRVLRKQPQPQQQVYMGRRVSPSPSVRARTVRDSGVAPYNRTGEDERDAFSTSSSDHSMQVRVTINPLIRCPARQPLPPAVQRDRVKSGSVGSSTVATAIRGNSNDDNNKMNSHSNNDNDPALPCVLGEASPAALPPVTSGGASEQELQGKPGPRTSVSELVVGDIIPFTRAPSTVEEAEALHEKIDKANDAMHTLPFSPKNDSVEVVKVCPDEHGSTDEERTWRPGKLLRVAYVTWNMAGRSANVQQLSSSCIHPNAHIIIIATQENGPYIGTNSSQRAFEKIVRRDCLRDQYIKIAFKRLWACHMMVLARKRDVAFYVSHVHTSKVPCGLLGFGGNKGAIGVAFSICVRQGEKVYHCSASTGDGSEGSEYTPKRVGDDKGDKQQQRPNSYSKHTASPAHSPPLCNSFMAATDEAAPPSPERDGAEGSLRSNTEARAVVPQHSSEPLGVAVADKMLEKSAEDMVALDPPQCSSSFITDAAAAPAIVVPPPCVTPTATCSEEVIGGGYSSQQYGMEDSEQTDGGLDTLSSVSVDTPLVTILCINAHFPAHQQAILERNECYHKIIERLKVGRKGKFKKYPWRVPTKAHTASITALSSRGSTPAQGSPAPSPAPPSPSPSSMSVTREDRSSEKESQTRNATDDFDITFFGGDLNYRINGTKAAIERIAKTRYYRSVLSANDQLNAEMRLGTVFNGFSEGKLEFRPTYKYQIKKAGSPSGVASDYQVRSDEKARMPAYCDRVLYKVNKQSRVERVNVHTYTDVQQVNTSDHRPVVALIDIYTKPLIFPADSSTKPG